MTAAEKRALRMLAAMPAGATETSLVHACGIKRATLDTLVRLGLAQTWVVPMHKPAIDVRWYAAHAGAWK